MADKYTRLSQSLASDIINQLSSDRIFSLLSESQKLSLINLAQQKIANLRNTNAKDEYKVDTISGATFQALTPNPTTSGDMVYSDDGATWSVLAAPSGNSPLFLQAQNGATVPQWLDKTYIEKLLLPHTYVGHLVYSNSSKTLDLIQIYNTMGDDYDEATISASIVLSDFPAGGYSEGMVFKINIVDGKFLQNKTSFVCIPNDEPGYTTFDITNFRPHYISDTEYLIFTLDGTGAGKITDFDVYLIIKKY